MMMNRYPRFQTNLRPLQIAESSDQSVCALSSFLSLIVASLKIGI